MNVLINYDFPKTALVCTYTTKQFHDLHDTAQDYLRNYLKKLNVANTTYRACQLANLKGKGLDINFIGSDSYLEE